MKIIYIQHATNDFQPVSCEVFVADHKELEAYRKKVANENDCKPLDVLFTFKEIIEK